jgi:hypothetical protein
MSFGVSSQSREARRGERSRAMLGLWRCDHDCGWRRCARRVRDDGRAEDSDIGWHTNAGDGVASGSACAVGAARSHAECLDAGRQRPNANAERADSGG